MYGKANTIAGSALNMHIAEYMHDSLKTWEQNGIWSKLLYNEVIGKEDQITGASYEKTIKYSRPQGPGGIGTISKTQWQNSEQPGNIGLMIPTGGQITIGTQFKYTTIHRTLQDSMADSQNLYEAIKNNEMGSQITEGLNEIVKSKIYKASTKTFALNKTEAEFNALASAAGAALTWADVKRMVEEKETYIVSLRNNHERASDAFNAAVASIAAENGKDASPANLVDNAAFAAAQEAYSKAWRTERFNSPRYIISGLDLTDQYKSSLIDASSIQIEKPELKTLYSTKNANQASPMLVLTGNRGYNQLWDDPEFQAVVAVSGFKHEEGLSGRHQRFLAHDQAINVQGILIVNLQQDELKYAKTGSKILDGGVSFGESVTDQGFVASTAFTAIPGHNFITRAYDGIGTNGFRVTTKTLDQVDMIDRFGWNEFTTVLFAWDVVLLEPEAFSVHVFLEDGTHTSA